MVPSLWLVVVLCGGNGGGCVDGRGVAGGVVGVCGCGVGNGVGVL